MEKKSNSKKVINGTKRDFEDSYKLLIELGSGANSVVWECKSYDRSGRFAVKITEKDAVDDIEGLEEEFEIISSIEHENIIRGYEMYITNDKVYTIIELIDGGELHDLINSLGKIDEDDGVAIASQLVQTVFYLHEKNICHRDIKPENILLTSDGTLKLSDFGLAIQLQGDETMRSCVGTQAYQAPEVLLGIPYTKSVDMWSIGATIFTMLAGAKPFPTDVGKELQRAKILNAEFSFADPVWRNVSKDGRDFISKLMKVKPADRLTAQQAIQHPWLQYIDLKDFNRRWLSKSRERKNLLREMNTERRKQERNNSQLSSSGTLRSSNSPSTEITISIDNVKTEPRNTGTRSRDVKRSTTSDVNTRVTKRERTPLYGNDRISNVSTSRDRLTTREKLQRDRSRDDRSSTRISGSTRYPSSPHIPSIPTRSSAITVPTLSTPSYSSQSRSYNAPLSARDYRSPVSSYSPSSRYTTSSSSSYTSSSARKSTYSSSPDTSSSTYRRRDK